MPDCDTADTVTVLVWLCGGGADGCVGALPEPAPPHPVNAPTTVMNTTSPEIIDSRAFRRLAPTSSSSGTNANASLPAFDPALGEFALNAGVAMFN